jgi:hypothetical protein
MIIILQYLCKRYLNTLYPALVLGKTSSGKTYWFNLLEKIILKNSIKIEASVTRNKFIGGQSSMTLNNSSKLFLPGYVETRDFIFINEMATEIEKYVANENNKNVDNNTNLFYLFKSCYDSSDKNTVNVGIQDSREIQVNAVSFAVGNFMTLKSNRRKYLNALKRNYRSLDGDLVGNFSINWPLFKPINYYKKVMQNETLARAHIRTREEYASYYMTGLDCAEQSRMTFFMVIDPASKQYDKENKEEYEDEDN